MAKRQAWRGAVHRPGSSSRLWSRQAKIVGTRRRRLAEYGLRSPSEHSLTAVTPLQKALRWTATIALAAIAGGFLWGTHVAKTGQESIPKATWVVVYIGSVLGLAGGVVALTPERFRGARPAGLAAVIAFMVAASMVIGYELAWDVPLV